LYNVHTIGVHDLYNISLMYNDFYMPLVYNVHDFYMSLGVPNPFRYLAYIVNNATQKHSIAQNLKVGGNPESSTKKKSFL